MPVAPNPDILADHRVGRMVILTDDESRENEGDLVLPAQFVSADAINFMLSVARGYLCLSLTESDCDRLDLHPQAPVNTTSRATAFTVSIDGHPRHGFTTGVAAKERAKTIRLAIDPASTPADFVRPGHINPLRSRNGGVLVRTGQTEGSLDLCRLAGLYPAAAIIEVMRDDGEMARIPDLVELGRKHNLRMCSVAQIIEHRLARESLVRRVEPVRGWPVRTALGDFTAYAYESVVDPLPHLVLTLGGIGAIDEGAGHDASAPPRARPISEPTLVRMHRRHLLGDVFGDLASSPEGATGDTLRAAMALIQHAGCGAIVYLRTQPAPDTPDPADHETLLHCLHRPESPPADAPHLTQPSGLSAGAVPTAQRDIGIGGQILRDLGLSRLRLITNHPRALPGLEAFGIEVVELVPVPVSSDAPTLA